MATPEWNEKQAVMRAFDPVLDAHRIVLAGGGLVFEKSTMTIPANSTVVVDTNLLSSFARIEYVLNFKNSPITVSKSMRLVGQNDSGLLSDSVSERLGGAINIQVGLTDDSIDAFLSVTNNESFALTLTLLKAKT